MRCQFCSDHPDLVSLPELLHRDVNDFDRDGHQFLVCPRCLSCDNTNLRDERQLTKNEQLYHSHYSRRDKRQVIFALCNSNGLHDEERRVTASDAFRCVKREPDVSTFEILADFFSYEVEKIETFFYNVKTYRNLAKHQ